MASLKQTAELESELHGALCTLFLLCFPKETIWKCSCIRQQLDFSKVEQDGETKIKMHFIEKHSYAISASLLKY